MYRLIVQGNENNSIYTNHDVYIINVIYSTMHRVPKGSYLLGNDYESITVLDW